MTARGPYRLASSTASAPIEFRFDGKLLRGIEGDTVASALLANGHRIVSRSFKYHRPRGIFTAGFEEPNALVQLHTGARTIPGVRSTLVPLSQGLEVSSAAGWPTVTFDALRAIDFAHSLFAAGFYNKAFMWPSWHLYEPIIRSLAGFGRAPTDPDPDRYDSQHAHCDVLVIGGGPSGIAAAKTAAQSGQRVMLVEQNASLSGENPASTQVLLRTTAFACYDHNLLALAESTPHTQTRRERLWLVRAGR